MIVEMLLMKKQQQRQQQRLVSISGIFLYTVYLIGVLTVQNYFESIIQTFFVYDVPDKYW